MTEETKTHITHNLQSGIQSLDTLGLSFSPGGLYIIGGRPGMGKTSLMLDIALHAAKDEGKPVWIFTLAESSEQILSRLLAKLSDISLDKILRNDSDSRVSLERFKSELTGLPISVFDQAMTVNAITQTIGSKERPGLICIDYVQLLQSRFRACVKFNCLDVFQPIFEGMDEIICMLKRTAQENNVPIVVLSQLSRRLEQRADKRPRLKDTRYCRLFEQLADAVLFIYRDRYYNESELAEKPDIAELIVAKNAAGALGTAMAEFDHKTVSFKD